MTNVVNICKSRGFTQMDIQLMDGLMAINLIGRELRVALPIVKATQCHPPTYVEALITLAEPGLQAKKRRPGTLGWA